jgi:UTP--glucose-1-phosphate uridylyltransferase
MTARGKSLDVLDDTRIKPGNLVTVRQQVPMGLGHAVWCAREIVGDEPFAIILPDELMVGKRAVSSRWSKPITRPAAI